MTGAEPRLMHHAVIRLLEHHHRTALRQARDAVDQRDAVESLAWSGRLRRAIRTLEKDNV